MTYFEQIYGNLDVDGQKKRYERLKADFIEQFGYNPAEYFSVGGRCELLGNHTDHNNGKVLVATINLDICACVCKTDNNIITVQSAYGIDKINCTDAEAKPEEKGTTTALIRGVVDYCNKKGVKVGGFDCTTHSLVPAGSGLSSSACFEVLICQIISSLYNNDELLPMKKAFAAHYAETVHFAKPCGLLDQCGTAFGGVSYIDFEDLNNPHVRSCQADIDRQIVLIKTTEDHSALTEHYSAIREDMSMVAQLFDAKVLRQVNEKKFDAFYASLPRSRAVDRAKHYFDENLRVEKGFDALTRGDLPTFYSLINQSGASSRYLLKNCQIGDEPNPPICHILDTLQTIDGNGAYRVHGGGFRGSVLAMINKSVKLDVLKSIFGENNVLPICFRQIGACKLDMGKLFEEK